MSTSSPVTLRTTSGPVTKMRPWSDMMTRSVSAGPYAAPPAAAPSTTEICGTLPDARVIAAKTEPTRVQGLDAFGQPGAAGVPQADDRGLGRDGQVVGLDDVRAAVDAHRAALQARVAREGDGADPADAA